MKRATKNEYISGEKRLKYVDWSPLVRRTEPLDAVRVELGYVIECGWFLKILKDLKINSFSFELLKIWFVICDIFVRKETSTDNN